MKDLEFDAEFYKHTEKTIADFENRDTKYDTGPLPPYIDTTPITEQKIEDIRKSDVAFAMFINQLRERENFYQKAMETAAKAKEQLSEAELKSKDRRLAVIIMTIAEIITSIGVGGIFTRYAVGFIFVVLSGLILTTLSLYLNFKK